MRWHFHTFTELRSNLEYSFSFFLSLFHLQINYQYRNGTTFPTALRTIYADGGIPRFYRGLLPALLQGPLSRFGDTAANAGSLTLLNSMESTKDLNVGLKTAVASVSAACFRIVLMPIDTVKVCCVKQIIKYNMLLWEWGEALFVRAVWPRPSSHPHLLICLACDRRPCKWLVNFPPWRTKLSWLVHLRFGMEPLLPLRRRLSDTTPGMWAISWLDYLRLWNLELTFLYKTLTY